MADPLPFDPQMLVDLAARGECAKSRRAALLFSAGGMTIGGYNDPPRPFVCTGSAACRAACNRVAIHAEARAIARASRYDIRGWSMAHLKVVDGKPVASGPPSCVQCSGLMLDAGLAWVWLLHPSGWTRYSAVEFHRLSLQHHNLPTDEVPHA